MSGVLLWFAALCACALFGWANYRRSRRVARRLLDLRLSEPRAPAPKGCGSCRLAEARVTALPSGPGSIAVPTPSPSESPRSGNER